MRGFKKDLGAPGGHFCLIFGSKWLIFDGFGHENDPPGGGPGTPPGGGSRGSKMVDF